MNRASPFVQLQLRAMSIAYGLQHLAREIPPIKALAGP